MLMKKLHAPEFVERNGVLYHCTCTNLFKIYYDFDGKLNDAEWNVVNNHDLDYKVYRGNPKPSKEEIVSSDVLFKYLQENNYYGTIYFNTGEGTLYTYQCFDDCLVCKSHKLR